MYVGSFFEGQVLPHRFRFFVSQQYVCGLVLWSTSAAWRIAPIVPSVCTWSRSLKGKCYLTLVVGSCAISEYVVSFFEGQVLPRNFHLFVWHQRVRGIVLWSTSAASPFRPLHVLSECTLSRPLKHMCCLTISASSCAIRMYVITLIEAQMLPDDFCLFMCHQPVRGLTFEVYVFSCTIFAPSVPSGSMGFVLSRINVGSLSPIHTVTTYGSYSMFFFTHRSTSDCIFSCAWNRLWVHALSAFHFCGHRCWSHFLSIAGTFPSYDIQIISYWVVFIFFDP
jgi:hypothetical protein